jgi:AcrR family transcriptional regulator
MPTRSRIARSMRNPQPTVKGVPSSTRSVDAKGTNLDGQIMGRKGSETRTRLLEAAALLLATTPLRALTTADVARKAGISPASFYLYFENVDALALALAESATDAAMAFINDLEAEWTWADPQGHIVGFVRAFFDHWDRYSAILRVRNLAVDEGDWAFQKTCERMTTPIYQAIEAKIALAKKAGRIDKRQHSVSLAAVAMLGIERSAATYQQFPRKYQITRERLIEAAVLMFKFTVLGPEPISRGQRPPA